MTARSNSSEQGAGEPHTLTDWLRRYTDADLIALLGRRPDLALPAPADLATLAGRASVRSSIARALDSVDAFTARVVEVIVVLGPDASVLTGQPVVPAADADAVRAAVARARDWLLVWGPDSQLHPVGTTREVIGPHPVGLGRSAADLFSAVNDITLAPLLRRLGIPPAMQPTSGLATAETVVATLPQLLEECDETELSILQRLAVGPPVGTLRTTAGRSDPVSPARRLVERGLLVPIDRETVELPREVGLALRPVPAGDVRSIPPEIPIVTRGVAVVEGGGSTAVLETVRLVEVLLNGIADATAVQLRTGGLGVRELRRLARLLDVPEPVTALLIEVAFESGLLSSTAQVDPSYLPTTEFDAWLRRSTPARWVPLASAWLAMTRLPSLIGQRDDRDKTIAALSADVERHSAPALRRQLLRLLADLPPGTAPVSADDVLDRLSWLNPRRASANRPVAEAVLAEAALLGVTGYGAMTNYTRALFDGVETGAASAESNAIDVLDAALPIAVEEFLLQPDLTAVVPGPPTTDLQRELSLAADLESSGGASVYRISPASLRRALDAGRTGSDLAQFFARSRTPVPQALDYLINDVATAHGRLRTGTATSYLRGDDVALLDRVMAEPGLDSLGLQRIAPTVLISTAGIGTVLDRLRAAGFAPAAESPDGALVSLAADAPRVPTRQLSRLSRVRAGRIPDAQLAEVVARMRAAEKLAHAVNHASNRVTQQIPGVTSASILDLLRAAIRNERTIALGFVDDAGVPSQRVLLPISLGGGVVRGHQPDDDRLHSYPLQRVTAVSLLDDGALDPTGAEP